MFLKRKSFLGITGLLLAVTLSGCSTNGASDISQSSDTPNTSQENTRELATIRGKVLTDTGEMVTAGIIVENEKGDMYRANTNIQSAYNLRLPAGKYKLHFVRGFEYSTVTKEIVVEPYKTYIVQDVRLIQLEDSYAKGWYRGDLHQHSYYSDGLNSVNEVFVSNLSNGLYYGFLSDHNTALGLPEWVQGNRMVANIDSMGNERYFGAYEAVEVTTEFGHYQSIGLGLTFDLYEVSLRDVERNKPKEEKDQIIKDRISYIGDTIKWAGGVAQINHPYSTSTMGFNYWDVIDSFDTIEIWNGYFFPGDGRYEPEKEGYQGQNYRSKMRWFESLNEIKNGGHFLAATSGTDNHDISGPYTTNPDFDENNIQTIEDYNNLFLKYGKFTGSPSTVVKIDGVMTQAKTLEAIRKGHSFMTNGPMIYASINGHSYGETVQISGDSVSASLELFARDGFESIKVIVNGEEVKTIPTNELTRLNSAFTIDHLADGDWVLFEVMGHGAQYAITNPIFIQKAKGYS